MTMRAPEADPAFLKACCADLWAHPGIRLLAGESLHPGGLHLTDRAVDRARWSAGDRVLNLGCGPGATEARLAERAIRAVGVDDSPRLAAEAAARAPDVTCVAADGERLPFRTGSFDGYLAECVWSVVPDLELAAAEAVRVVRRGGRIAISDVTRTGALPAPLDDVVAWVACAAGAMPADGYVEAMERAGATDLQIEDAGEGLRAMIAKARRRLSLLEGSVETGLVDLGEHGVDASMIARGRSLLDLAGAAAAEGLLGYVLIVGTGAG